MELVIGGAVILLGGALVVWKLLHKSAPSETTSSTIDAAVTEWLSKARANVSEGSEAQAVAIVPAQAEAEQPQKSQDNRQATAKVLVPEEPQQAPAAAHTEPLDMPPVNKIVEPASTSPVQNATARVEEAPLNSKDDAEDWGRLVSSLTAKGSEDDDTELVLEED